MRNRRGIQFAPAVAVALATALAACGGSSPTLETSAQYGIYLLEDGDELVRIDGSPEWERRTWARRSSLESPVTLVVHDPAVAGRQDMALLRDRILLERVAHVRDEVDVMTGTRDAAGGNLWVATHMQALEVPVDFGPVPERPGMVMVRARSPLLPGLYSIRVGEPGSATLARFGIAWNAVDKQAYADRYCADRYRGQGRTAYFPCGEEPALAADGLSIGGLATDRRTVAGVPTLVVAGRIENATAEPRRLPQLRARLLSGTGVEQSWNFQLNRAYILPGEALGFSSEVRYPMENTQQVVVGFLPAAGS